MRRNLINFPISVNQVKSKSSFPKTQYWNKNNYFIQPPPFLIFNLFPTSTTTPLTIKYYSTTLTHTSYTKKTHPTVGVEEKTGRKGSHQTQPAR